jgi:cytochrome c oxidase subunit II
MTHLSTTTCLLLSRAAAAAADGSFWLPPARSSGAAAVDAVFYFILGVSTFFFLLIVALMTLFVILYRRRPGVQPGPAPTHNTGLEVVWTVIPLGIAGYIFYQGFTGYMELRHTPPNTYNISVRAQKWKWIFGYDNGNEEGDLHVPVDRPVRLTMTSEDVIHSLFIPNFRLKMDVVPGRYTTTWFKALEPGTYDLYCAEYCGTGHSDMLAKVIVHEPGQFEKWLQEAGDLLKKLPPAEAGRRLVKMRCTSCHTIDGSPLIGPSFKGIWGQTHTFTNAQPTAVDENYVRESILEPAAKIREGYQPTMPTFKGILSDQQITAIIEFLKTLP